MKVTMLIMGLALAISFLTGCQTADTLETLRQLHEAGQLTDDQYESAVEIAKSGGDLGTIASQIGVHLLNILVTLGVIRQWRGSINHRRGAVAPNGSPPINPNIA